MGRFMDLVEANKQRDHEVRMRRTGLNRLFLGAAAVAAAVAVAGRKTTIKIKDN